MIPVDNSKNYGNQNLDVSKSKDLGDNKRIRPNEILMQRLDGVIQLLFKDQYGDGHAKILDDHHEHIPLKGNQFRKFLTNFLD